MNVPTKRATRKKTPSATFHTGTSSSISVFSKSERNSDTFSRACGGM